MPILIASLLSIVQGDPVQRDLNEIQRLIQDRQWPEARAKAEGLLAKPGLQGAFRASAERHLSRCHEASGEFALADAAVVRAMREPGGSASVGDALFRGKMRLALKDPQGAAAAYAAGFEAAARQPKPALRSRQVGDLLGSIPGQKPQGNDWKAVLAAAEQGEGPGFQAVLGVIRPLQGDFKGAVAAFAKARETWKDDPVLLRAQVRAAARGGDGPRALALHAELLPLHKAQIEHLSDFTARNLTGIHLDVVNGCLKSNDVASAKAFARALSAEPLNETWLPLAELLKFAKDAGLNDEIDAVLVKNAADEWQRFHAHYPAACGWHALGAVEKSVAYYRDVTADKGWGDAYVQTARAWITMWTEKKP